MTSNGGMERSSELTCGMLSVMKNVSNGPAPATNFFQLCLGNTAWVTKHDTATAPCVLTHSAQFINVPPVCT
jgi:hypothetical protein